MNVTIPSLSIRSRQRRSIEQMLLSCTSAPGDLLEDNDDVWKVLIYDEVGRDIIAPLLRVADLRSAGVTLHMMLHSTRQPIRDVPAVYFVSPTEQNISRICTDASSANYASIWINFTTSCPRQLLETFAEKIAASTPPDPLAGRVARVYDMYTSFLALEDNLFSLNIPGVYAKLNSAKITNTEVDACVEHIVSHLFCSIVTLGVVPIIRAQKGGPAMLVAQKLEKRIREHLISSNNVFSEAGTFAAAPTDRPLLVIVDRSIDLSVMLHHTWTYQALSHDTLGLKLNRVTVPVKDGESNGLMATPKKKSLDLDKSDIFWAKNAGLPFPMVAEAVEVALQDYKTEVSDLNRSAGAIGNDAIDPMSADLNDANTADKLAAAISNIPELTKKKRMIDLHTNIATALLDQIKDRGLDGFYQVEKELLLRPSNFDVERVLAIIRDMRGLPSDKLRLFLIYYLCVDSASSNDLERCTSALTTAGCADLRAYSYLKSIRAFTKSISSVPSAPLSNSSSITSGYAASFVDTLSQVASNVNKLIISTDDALASARVMQTLMDHKGDTEILDGYAYLDPKAPKGSTAGQNTIRQYKEAILFVVGPGNYIEFQNCQDHLCSKLKQEGKVSKLVPNGKTVIYGATEMCTGTEFLQQLQANGGPDPSQNGTSKT